MGSTTPDVDPSTLVLKQIVVRRTITVTDVIDYTPEMYPDMSVDQAAQYERDLALPDKIQNIVETLSYIEDGEKNQDGTEKFEFSETVTIKDK